MTTKCSIRIGIDNSLCRPKLTKQPSQTKGRPTAPKQPPKLDPVADRKARAECRQFLKAFGPVGAVYFADGLTFQEAKARYRGEHADEHEDLKCQTGDSTTAHWIQRFRHALRRPKHQH